MAGYLSDGNGNLMQFAGLYSGSTKANIDASNLSNENVLTWRNKLNVKNLTAGNGISIENDIIKCKNLYNDYIVNSDTSNRTINSSNSPFIIVTKTIEKVEDNSVILINYACPLRDNSNGYSSGIGIMIDDVYISRVISNMSGFFSLNRIVGGLSKGTHTLKFYAMNGGSGTTTIPAYETITGSIVEVF